MVGLWCSQMRFIFCVRVRVSWQELAFAAVHMNGAGTKGSEGPIAVCARNGSIASSSS